MDTYDATKMILTRLQTLDPENASKIMGYILIQDLGDKELIRLAHGPEIHLVSLINKASSFLGLSSNMLSTTTNGSKFFQFSSPKIMVPSSENNGFYSHHHTQLESPSLSSSSPSSPWSNSFNGFPRKCEIVNGGGNMKNSNSCLTSDEFHGIEDSMAHGQIMTPSGLTRSDSSLWSYDDHSTPHGNPFHRRSCSVNDAYMLEDGDDGGQNSHFLGGWRPCMYFARGFCKNGSNCKFSHAFDASAGELSRVGSPNNMDEFEWMRMKAIQQQRLAAASELIAAGPRHSFPYKRSTAAALMGEEFHKFGAYGADMNNLSGMGLDCSSNSRQIYLTFPADSAFTEEDVSNYFSMYGLVHDVRIPYQQKRMFGFVTFIYPETVNLILAKGNPHFVCDSRVLVKPYKEKGKVAEKKLQRHPLPLLDRGEFPACLSPTGFDAREPYDLSFGGRTFCNLKEMMLRNKLVEQAELQQAVELHGRRLMNMHLMDLKNNYKNHQSCPSFPPAFPLTSRLQTHPPNVQNIFQPSDVVDVDVEVEEVKLTGLDTGGDPAADVIETDKKGASGICDDNNGCEGGSKEAKVEFKYSGLRESLEHIFPDNLFASPTKTPEHRSLPECVQSEADSYKAVLSSTCTTLGAVESVKSCHFQLPRFPSAQGVVKM